MYEELSAFIGLIVIELQTFRQKEMQYNNEDVNWERISEIKKIIERLHDIQEMLEDKKKYNNTCIKEWNDEYKLGENIISLLPYKLFPTGYCFVAKAVCKRMEQTEIIVDLYNFLDTLGYYIKYYYYDE